MDAATAWNVDTAAIYARMVIEESDRGCAVFGAQFIDDSLKILIDTLLSKDSSRTKLVRKLVEGYGPLATFSARLDVVYALGVLSHDDYEGIQIVRKIRNKMAHERGPITFDHPTIKQLLTKLAVGRVEDMPSVPTFLINRLTFAVSVIFMAGKIGSCVDISKILGERTLWHSFLGTIPRTAFDDLKQTRAKKST